MSATENPHFNKCWRGMTCNVVDMEKLMGYVNTFASGLNQVVHVKQLDRTWLCTGISPVW